MIQTPEWKIFVEMKESDLKDIEDVCKELEKSGKGESKKIEMFDAFNANGAEAKSLLFQVALPLLVHGHSVVLECSEVQLYMTVANFYELVLYLPCEIIKEDVKAFFDCSKRILFIRMPVSVYLFATIPIGKGSCPTTDEGCDNDERRISF